MVVTMDQKNVALNEIFATLKKELSPAMMKDLKTAQIKWIDQKEKIANEERQKYIGKTHEWVAYYITSNKSKKDICFELVNEYITD